MKNPKIEESERGAIKAGFLRERERVADLQLPSHGCWWSDETHPTWQYRQIQGGPAHHQSSVSCPCEITVYGGPSIESSLTAHPHLNAFHTMRHDQQTL